MYNINIDGLIFEWDEKKNITNIKKHGISFQEAMTVFYDDDAIVFDDPDHSIEECRFLIIGMSGREGICIVSHCYRGGDDRVRIISARRAEKGEISTYNTQFRER